MPVSKSCCDAEGRRGAASLAYICIRKEIGSNDMEKETVSIYTIAKEAGVSPATVSRVLTGSARVSEEKRLLFTPYI